MSSPKVLNINENYCEGGAGGLKGTRGVQHDVWTRLHSFMIIRRYINITMLKPYIF